MPWAQAWSRRSPSECVRVATVRCRPGSTQPGRRLLGRCASGASSTSPKAVLGLKNENCGL